MILKSINPPCVSKPAHCPDGYDNVGHNTKLTNLNVRDPCTWPTWGTVNQCRLNWRDQSVINAYDPLRSKIYSDTAKTETLNTNDPAFEINIQKLFKCCSGDITDQNQQEECGGYWRQKKTGTQCNTNCLPTIEKYCKDLKSS